MKRFFKGKRRRAGEEPPPAQNRPEKPRPPQPPALALKQRSSRLDDVVGARDGLGPPPSRAESPPSRGGSFSSAQSSPAALGPRVDMTNAPEAEELRALLDQLAAAVDSGSPELDEDATVDISDGNGRGRVATVRPYRVVEEVLRVSVETPAALPAVMVEKDVATAAKVMAAYVQLERVALRVLKFIIIVDREVPALRPVIATAALAQTLGVMLTYKRSEEVQAKGLKLLVNISTQRDASKELVVHKAVRIIGDALRHHSRSRYVSEKAVLLFHNLAQSEENHFEILRQNGLQTIFQVIRLSGRGRPVVRQLAMDILGRLVAYASRNEISKARSTTHDFLFSKATDQDLTDSASDDDDDEEEEEDEGLGEDADSDSGESEHGDLRAPTPRKGHRTGASDGVLVNIFRGLMRRPSGGFGSSGSSRQGLGIGSDLGNGTEDDIEGFREAREAVQRCAAIHSVLGVGKFSAVLLCTGFGYKAQSAPASPSAAAGAAPLITGFAFDRNAPLAIKVMLRPWSNMTDGQRCALTREAGLLLALTQDNLCPNIVALFDVCLVGRHCVFVFPHGGPDAHFLIAEGGPFTVTEAQSLARQLFRALAHMGERGIVHRDVKPENLLISTTTAGGLHLQLADLGFARTLSREAPLALPLGTFGYIAPEMLFGDGYGTGVDVWSAGITVLRMLHGYPKAAAADVEAPKPESQSFSESFHDDPWRSLYERFRAIGERREEMLTLRAGPPTRESADSEATMQRFSSRNSSETRDSAMSRRSSAWKPAAPAESEFMDARENHASPAESEFMDARENHASPAESEFMDARENHHDEVFSDVREAESPVQRQRGSRVSFLAQGLGRDWTHTLNCVTNARAGGIWPDGLDKAAGCIPATDDLSAPNPNPDPSPRRGSAEAEVVSLRPSPSLGPT